MEKINPQLLLRLQGVLGVSRARVYALIQAKVNEAHLPRNLAAIALASERGIGISKYATTEDLAVIRQAARSSAPSSVVVPPPQPPTVKKRATSSRAAKPEPARRRGITVFVVHGRNVKLQKAMFAFLRALGLQPLEWNQVLKLTGEPTPYIGTVLDTAFREAVAIVVLLTPDDEARLKTSFRGRKEPKHETSLTGQARPNVLFEAGMAFGRSAGNSVLVQVGEVRPFSDVAGRHVVHMSNAPTSRQELATKLANAGCNVDTSGADWLTEGDFSL
jgi:predicted nucleotide-binding protein